MKKSGWAVFIVLGACGIGVNVMMGCGQPMLRYPSCGEFHFRATDGASCQECIDKDGAGYAHCTNRVDRVVTLP